MTFKMTYFGGDVTILAFSYSAIMCDTEAAVGANLQGAASNLIELYIDCRLFLPCKLCVSNVTADRLPPKKKTSRKSKALVLYVNFPISMCPRIRNPSAGN